jgi:rhodanese-related sulfurtransferase
MAEPRSVEEMLADARAQLQRVTPAQALAEQAEGALIVDTRTFEQRQAHGLIPRAKVIDRTVFEWRLDPASPHADPDVGDHGRRVIVVCSQGYSSSLAAASLQALGLHRATDMIGGFEAWKADGLPVEPFVSSDPP